MNKKDNYKIAEGTLKYYIINYELSLPIIVPSKKSDTRDYISANEIRIHIKDCKTYDPYGHAKRLFAEYIAETYYEQPDKIVGVISKMLTTIEGMMMDMKDDGK